MKFLKYFLILFLILGSTSFLYLKIYDVYFNEGPFSSGLFDYLADVAGSKAERVQVYLDERKNDAIILGEYLDMNDVFYLSMAENQLPGYVKEKLAIFETKLKEGLEETLLSFKKSKGYSNIILIDPDGMLIWDSNTKKVYSENLNLAPNDETEIGRLYERMKKNLGAGISDSGDYSQDNQLSVFATYPVMETAEDTGKRLLKGFVALQLDNDMLNKMIGVKGGLLDYGRSYIINRDGRQIFFDTSDNAVDLDSAAINDDVIISSGRSELANKCFRDYDNYYLIRRGEEPDHVEKSGFYQDKSGRKILGAHQYILQSGWCVLFEVGWDDFIKYRLTSSKWGNKNNYYFFALALLILLIMGFIIDKYYDLKQFNIKGRKK